ncbi:MAG: DinB family protein [Chloroflexota bacterium]|nr:DinB family protein [Chloroflexota bacterium]
MTLAEFAIDIPAVIEKRRTLIEEAAGIKPDDLPALTNELYDHLDGLIAGIDDAAVGFVPTDPDEDGAPGWTLGHVVVHLTAGLEENAAQGCTLARGADISGRPRYETPWQEVTTAAHVRQRLAESRRMTLALLDAWPDTPHLTNVDDHSFFGPVNAVAYHALGISHATDHFAQLEEIQRQTS